MPYSRTTWVNGVTALAAPALNNLELGVLDAVTRLDGLKQAATLTYQFSGNLDASNPMEWDFVLPPGVTTINFARLVVRGKGARGITALAEAVVGDTGSTAGNTIADGGHSHDLHVNSVDTTVASGHTHMYGLAFLTHTAPTHSHSVASHAHTLGAHTHNLTRAIALSTTPTGVTVQINNGAGYGAVLASGSDPVLIDVDITGGITVATAVKRLRVTSTRLGMVDVVLMIGVI